MSWTYEDKGLQVTGFSGGAGSSHSFHGESIIIGGGGVGGGGSMWLSGATQKYGTAGAKCENPGGGGGGSAGHRADGTAGMNGKIWLFYNHEG